MVPSSDNTMSATRRSRNATPSELFAIRKFSTFPLYRASLPLLCERKEMQRRLSARCASAIRGLGSLPPSEENGVHG